MPAWHPNGDIGNDGYPDIATASSCTEKLQTSLGLEMPTNQLIMKNSGIGLIAGVIIICGLIGYVVILVLALKTGLAFDDAYMFLRYAQHFWSGLGLSWNPDGAHTYGMTSLVWTAFVILLAKLPTSGGNTLILASWSFGGLSLIALWLFAKSISKSHQLKQDISAASLSVVPLLLNWSFLGNACTGMETMLALFLNVIFVYLFLRQTENVTTSTAVSIIIIGSLNILTRPESIVVVTLTPVLWFLVERTRRVLMYSLAEVVAILGFYLLTTWICFEYFSTPFPLSFYVKSLHGYAGYLTVWNAHQYLFAFFATISLYIVILMAIYKHEHWRIILIFFIPPVMLFGYLESVTQIMGANSRFYIPYYPFFVLPTIKLLDSWILSKPWVARDYKIDLSLKRIIGIATVVVLSLSSLPQAEFSAVYKRWKQNRPALVPELHISSQVPLPERDWFKTITVLADDVFGRLPPAETVAMSEVGLIGFKAPNISIIDLVGLNDRNIATRGFSTDYLLSRKPEIIWFPHTDYTSIRREIFSDARIFKNYLIISGAFNYGLAIRRDLYPNSIEFENVRTAWDKLYPGIRLENYIVQAEPLSSPKFFPR